MTLADVERGFAGGPRAHARRLGRAARGDDDAEREFVWETVDHYEEHLPSLRAFADGTG